MEKKFFLISVVVAFIVATLVIGCGSNWTITGNSLVITPLEKDSVISAGSYVITPVDSL